jgi:hypothetical protein
MYPRPPIKTRIGTAVGTKEGTRMLEDRSRNSHIHHPKGDGEKFFCWLHGINAYHHTHHCPSAIKKKMEWEAEEKAKARGLAVNHFMKCQNPGQFRALQPPYLMRTSLPTIHPRLHKIVLLLALLLGPVLVNLIIK